MILSDIIKTINKIVANSSSFQLNYNNLEFYINSAVDYINLELKTQMLNPQEAWESDLVLNNLLYNSTVKATFRYLGDYDSAPSGVEADIYYNNKEEIYYFYNTDWVPLYSEEDGPGDNFFGILSNKVLSNYEYRNLPEQVIRSVLIYYTAASYLEEEDEFESQYKTYMNKAVDNLDKIRKTYYSMYDLDNLIKHHHKPQNPYWIGDEDV